MDLTHYHVKRVAKLADPLPDTNVFTFVPLTILARYSLFWGNYAMQCMRTPEEGGGYLVL